MFKALYHIFRKQKIRVLPVICVCMLSHFSCVRIFVTPWTVAHQAPLSMGSLQARILEWVAKPSSRGSSQPRNPMGPPALQADSLPAELPGKRNCSTSDKLEFKEYKKRKLGEIQIRLLWVVFFNAVLFSEPCKCFAYSKIKFKLNRFLKKRQMEENWI